MRVPLLRNVSVLVASLLLTGGTIAHAQQLLNGGFEDPISLNHWTVTGYAQTVDSTFGKIPPEGLQQAYLDNDTTPRGTPPSGAVDVATLESALGLASGTLSGLKENGTTLGTVINGSAISQSAVAQKGDSVLFTWDFLTAEDPTFSPQNDFAFAVVDGKATVLGSFQDATTALPFNGTLSPPSTDDFLSETGYHSAKITFTSAGTHSISFGVVNVGNNGITSALLVDQVVVAPEPGFAAPFALGVVILLGGLWRRRMRVVA